DRDGRMLRSAADRGLVEALAPLELPTTTGVTAAARARSGGWRSVGLQGGLDDPARIVKTLAEAARLAAGAE
ncbi:MAG: hypothetical protein VX000_10430, partial [Myxococcota bacterium]|nr:hypothetical protein [Myxococcota bacterium]